MPGRRFTLSSAAASLIFTAEDDEYTPTTADTGSHFGSTCTPYTSTNITWDPIATLRTSVHTIGAIMYTFDVLPTISPGCDPIARMRTPGSGLTPEGIACTMTFMSMPPASITSNTNAVLATRSVHETADPSSECHPSRIASVTTISKKHPKSRIDIQNTPSSLSSGCSRRNCSRSATVHLGSRSPQSPSHSVCMRCEWICVRVHTRVPTDF